MFCTRCGVTDDNQALFCQRCGAALSGGGGRLQAATATSPTPEYEPPSWALPVLGWLAYAVGLLGFLAGQNGMGVVALIASTIIVGWDASRIGVRHLQHSSLKGLSGIDRSSTVAWTRARSRLRWSATTGVDR